VSRTLPVRLAPRTPLLARLTTDGAYLRAMFGPLALLAPLAGAVVGLLAVLDTHGRALPPTYGLLLAIVLLGIADAAAGFAASVVFTVGVVASGGAQSLHSVFSLMGLAAVAFATPLIASAARPFRRPPAEGTAERWRRLGDYVIAPLVGAWALQKMIGALPGLTGLHLPIAGRADRLGVIALAAIIVRLGLESLASGLYPDRLAAVSPEKIPFSSTRQRWAATFLRTGIFTVASWAFIGSCWQLWVGALLFVLPQLLKIHEGIFRNRPWIYEVLPRGITKTVVMLFVGKWFGVVLVKGIVDPLATIRDGFILLALPGLALSIIDLMARDGVERKEPGRTYVWSQHLVGGALVVVGFLFVRGQISFM
jgi:hypothetical protein